VESIHNKLRTIEIVLLQAKANYKLKLKSNALRELKYAVELARAGEWIRPFLDTGSEIFDLLLQLQKKNIESKFIKRIISAFEEEENRNLTNKAKTKSAKLFSEETTHPAEQLTSREIDILKLIAQGLRNREIAEKVYLSPTTVKKHIYNIYQKLEVHTRIEAATKARELNLIS
jgi:LuxR family maltose regulon positive regulatory protein